LEKRDAPSIILAADGALLQRFDAEAGKAKRLQNIIVLD